MQRADHLGLPPQGRGERPRTSRKGNNQFRHGCTASVARRVSGQLYRRAFTASNYYWSSTENDGSNAWNQNFNNGNQNRNNKTNTYYVRAVRR